MGCDMDNYCYSGSRFNFAIVGAYKIEFGPLLFSVSLAILPSAMEQYSMKVLVRWQCHAIGHFRTLTSQRFLDFRTVNQTISVFCLFVLFCFLNQPPSLRYFVATKPKQTKQTKIVNQERSMPCP